MLDQSFSTENFRKIYDIENRRGVFLDGLYFPTLQSLARDIKSASSNIREFKKTASLSPEEYNIKLTELREIAKECRKAKDMAVDAEMETVSRLASQDSFKISLTMTVGPGSKNIFKIGSDPASFFVMKQIQYNIRKTYKVKQSNRFEIVCQLRDVLQNKLPKHVVKADISDFYESVDSAYLIRLLNRDQLLAPRSRQHIQKIIKDFNQQSSTSTGLPRGIGFSAYLSELYMRQLDEAIRAHPDILYYARYVDDIVAVFLPDPVNPVISYLNVVETELNKLKLSLNTAKSDCYIVPEKAPTQHSFDFLGYKFLFGTGIVTLLMSDKKRARYEQRIAACFDAFAKQYKSSQKVAKKTLIRRIQFLTGNTRLRNSKKNVLVGIYFSNALLNPLTDLLELDSILKKQCKALKIPSLRKKLKPMSFEAGYVRRMFFPFTIKQISNIVKVWQ